MAEEYRYQIILPGGELEKDVLELVEASDLRSRRTDGFRLRVEDLPLDLVTDRASSVPERVTDPEATNVIGGVTGNDILWENRLRGEGLVLPVSSGASVYVGATPRLRDEVGDPDLSDLSGWRVDTKFPNITSDVLTESGVEDVDVRFAPGKIEAQHFMYPRSRGLLDIWGSGRTARRNGITVIEFVDTLRPVTVNLFEGRGMDNDKRRVIADFGAALYVGATKKSMLHHRVPVAV